MTSSTATCSLFDSNKEKGTFLSPICQIQQTAFNLRFCVFNVSWSSSVAIKERFLIVKPSMLKVFVASALRASVLPSLIFWHYEIYIEQLQIAFLFSFKVLNICKCLNCGEGILGLLPGACGGLLSVLDPGP